MPGGVRFKFAGSTIGVAVDMLAPKTITAVTKSAACIVTAALHEYSSGDVVRIFNIAGMTELNGGTFVITVLSPNTFILMGVNSSEYGAYVGGGISTALNFTNFCELTGYNRQGGSSAEIDATSLCSTEVESEVGLPDYGTTQLDYNFAPRTTVQNAINVSYINGTILPVRVNLPKSGGYMIQLGFVQQTSEQAAVGGLWTGSLTLKNTGRRIDIAAPLII